jgi:hypothetical protein
MSALNVCAEALPAAATKAAVAIINFVVSFFIVVSLLRVRCGVPDTHVTNATGVPRRRRS